jgi:hypothetical protein
LVLRRTVILPRCYNTVELRFRWFKKLMLVRYKEPREGFGIHIATCPYSILNYKKPYMQTIKYKQGFALVKGHKMLRCQLVQALSNHGHFLACEWPELDETNFDRNPTSNSRVHPPYFISAPEMVLGNDTTTC